MTCIAMGGRKRKQPDVPEVEQPQPKVQATASNNVPVQSQGVQVTNVHQQEQNKHGSSAKLRHSTFHLIANTNQRHIPHSIALTDECNRLQFATSGIIDGDNCKNFVKFLKPGHSWTKQFIKGAITKGAIERGEKYDQVHAHMLISIAHYSSVHLDLDKIKQHFLQATGLPSMYFKLQVHKRAKSPEQILEEYLDKNMSGVQTEPYGFNTTSSH